MDRNAPIQELNGVGPKTEKILQKLGVYTVGDILLAFPRDYKRMPEPEHISVTEPEKVYAFHVRLCSSPVTRNTRAMQISTAQFSDGTGKVEAVWFRMLLSLHRIAVVLTYLWHLLKERTGRNYSI